MHSVAIIFASLALLVSIWGMVIAYRAVRRSIDYSVRSVSLAKIVALEGELTDTRDLIESLRTSMHKLRSRRRMRELNEDRSAALPEDRESLKKHLRARVGMIGVPKHE